MTRSDAADDDVYRLVKAVFEHLETLRRSHPSLARLAPARMVSEGMTAPLHPGARRYYEEVGLLPAEH